jgi:hypothetical protein
LNPLAPNRRTVRSPPKRLEVRRGLHGSTLPEIL